MVTTRIYGDAKTFKRYYEEMLTRWGASYTLTRETITRDGMGTISATSSSSSTITGVFERVEDQTELVKLGLGNTGVAKFYADADDTIYTRDQLTVESETWEFRKLAEDDHFGDGTTMTKVAQSWVLVKIDG